MVCIKFLDNGKVFRCNREHAEQYVLLRVAAFCKKEEWKATGRNYL